MTRRPIPLLNTLKKKIDLRSRRKWCFAEVACASKFRLVEYVGVWITVWIPHISFFIPLALFLPGASGLFFFLV